MDVFLPRMPNGTSVPTRCSSDLITAELLQAQSVTELSEEICQLKQRRQKFVSVRRQQVFRLGRDRLQHMLSSSGIQIATIGYAGGFTGSLGPGYHQAVNDTRRAIELAADLNARAVVVLPGARGNHTYNHANATIRKGIDRCLDDALRLRIDIQIPLNSVIGRRGDVFLPQGLRPLEWIEEFGSHRVKGLMVLRRSSPWGTLPDCWQECLLSGGILRLSRSCQQLEGVQSVISHIIHNFSAHSISRVPVTT